MKKKQLRWLLPLVALPVLWLLYWGIYQSMVHFYFDGFLWKMRKKSVRANI